MKIKKFISVALLVAIFTFPGGTIFAAKAELVLSKVPQTVEEATVNLYCRFRNGNKTMSTSGSGVFISDRGVILTNAHVAQYFLIAKDNKGNCSVRTGSPAKKTYSASVLFFPLSWAESFKDKPEATDENDFALLYITDANSGKFPTLPFDVVSNFEEGERVTIAGYPTEKLSFKGVQNKLKQKAASSTILNARSFVKNLSSDLLTLAPSAAASPGVSGGPVLDEANKLIAIVTSKSSAKDDRTLRAITLPYIDRSVRAQTGISLEILLRSDLNLQALVSEITLTPEIRKIFTKSFFKRK